MALQKNKYLRVSVKGNPGFYPIVQGIPAQFENDCFGELKELFFKITNCDLRKD